MKKAGLTELEKKGRRRQRLSPIAWMLEEKNILERAEMGFLWGMAKTYGFSACEKLNLVHDN